MDVHDWHPVDEMGLKPDELCEKNKALRTALDKKIAQILEFPQRFKPLRAPLQNA